MIGPGCAAGGGGGGGATVTHAGSSEEVQPEQQQTGRRAVKICNPSLGKLTRKVGHTATLQHL